jgi:predicted TIM-barrel fold metal-dependent hydrolase
VVDAHNHLGPDFGGEWASRPVTELLAAMDEAGVAALVDLDGGGGDALSRAVERTQAAHPGRFAVFAGLAYDAWRTEAAFGELEAERLRDAAGRGARGLKVWKHLGLVARDPVGRLVAVDDARLDPLWRTAGELGLPVTIHVADPIAFFAPLTAENERYEELTEHPDWHFWPPRDPGRADDPDATGFPTFDELMAGLDRVLARHPGTTFIGAHVGCAAEDLALVSGMLERHPRYLVDLAARLGELGRQPYTARAFFLRWADRILYGTDHPTDPVDHRLHARFLETWDESFDYGRSDPPGQGRWQICGLGLPDEVLRQVYAENARRLIRFD